MDSPILPPTSPGPAIGRPSYPGHRDLALERLTVKERQWVGKPISGVDVALGEVSLGFGESVFIDPRTGRAI